jgi:hypothetical protein
MFRPKDNVPFILVQSVFGLNVIWSNATVVQSLFGAILHLSNRCLVQCSKMLLIETSLVHVSLVDPSFIRLNSDS